MYFQFGKEFSDNLGAETTPVFWDLVPCPGLEAIDKNSINDLPVNLYGVWLKEMICWGSYAGVAWKRERVGDE